MLGQGRWPWGGCYCRVSPCIPLFRVFRVPGVSVSRHVAISRCRGRVAAARRMRGGRRRMRVARRARGSGTAQRQQGAVPAGRRVPARSIATCRDLRRVRAECRGPGHGVAAEHSGSEPDSHWYGPEQGAAGQRAAGPGRACGGAAVKAAGTSPFPAVTSCHCRDHLFHKEQGPAQVKGEQPLVGSPELGLVFQSCSATEEPLSSSALVPEPCWVSTANLGWQLELETSQRCAVPPAGICIYLHLSYPLSFI